MSIYTRAIGNILQWWYDHMWSLICTFTIFYAMVYISMIFYLRIHVRIDNCNHVIKLLYRCCVFFSTYYILSQQSRWQALLQYGHTTLLNYGTLSNIVCDLLTYQLVCHTIQMMTCSACSWAMEGLLSFQTYSNLMSWMTWEWPATFCTPDDTVYSSPCQ